MIDIEDFPYTIQFFSLGKDHEFSLNGHEVTWHHIIAIWGDNANQCRDIMFAIRGKEWAFQYPIEHVTHEMLDRDFPCGIIEYNRPMGDPMAIDFLEDK
jgi:hypothetical protein